MKLDASFQGVGRPFFDTAPIIYYVERHPRYAAIAEWVFDQLDSGRVQGVTSAITLAECLVVPIRLELVHVRQAFVELMTANANMTFVTLRRTSGGVASPTWVEPRRCVPGLDSDSCPMRCPADQRYAPEGNS